MNRRIIAYLLCLTMAFSLCSVATARAAIEPYTGNMTKLTEEPYTLEMFVTFDSSRYVKFTSYAEVPSMKRMSEITNIYPEFIHPASGSAAEQLNLLLSSGKLPDIIYYDWSVFNTTPDQMYEDGLILDLTDLIEQYAPNLKALMVENPQIKKDITTDKGIMPAFHQMQFSEPLKNTYAYLIRADWLKKVGKDVPVTLDDWYDVLVAFRDNDLNGDGDPSDEIPLTTGLFTPGTIDTIALEAFYWAWGKQWGMYVNEDQHAAYGAYDKDYKDYLLLMRKWIEEGLVDPDFVSNDKTQQDAKFLNSKAGALRSGMGAGFGTFIAGLGDPTAVVAALTPVRNEGDVSYNFAGFSAGVTKVSAVITKDCERPDLAVQWLDMFYGGDGMMLANYGIEGEAYNVIDGYPTLVEYITRNPDGKSINVALAEFSMGCSSFPFWNDTAVREQRMLSYPAQREAGLRMAEMDLSRTIPNISLTAEETTEYAGIISEVETYVKEMTVAFLLGKNDIESGFDSYMKDLKSLGIEDAITIYDAALQRYYAR
ncbi:MAG: hypothetical protein ACOX62_03925 [Christensenellales bacterium]|jgi:putative aldouronate transport system substrate-binding protein